MPLVAGAAAAENHHAIVLDDAGGHGDRDSLLGPGGGLAGRGGSPHTHQQLLHLLHPGAADQQSERDHRVVQLRAQADGEGLHDQHLHVAGLCDHE